MGSSRQTIIKEILRAVSVQLDSTNLVKCLMVHGISWSGCTSGIVEMGVYEYAMHFDGNTILPSYGKRTTNRRVVSFVKSVQVKQEILERTATRIFPFALSSSRGQKSPQREERGHCYPTTLPAVRTMTWILCGYSPDDGYKHLVIPTRVLVRVEKQRQKQQRKKRA